MDQIDLHEYPKDHIGRKTFVTVRGIRRMVAKIYTYMGSDGRYRLLPEYGGEQDDTPKSPFVMSDIGEYWSPLSGEMVSSRSVRRAEMRQYGVVEVGNDRNGFRKSGMNMPPVGPDIKRAIEQLKSGN